MPGIEKEVIVFLIAVLSGASVRLVYKCLGCFREIVKHSLVLMGAEDLIFWISAAVYLFIQIYQTNSGRIRWHFILGVVIGAVLMSFFVKKSEKIWGIFLRKKS